MPDRMMDRPTGSSRRQFLAGAFSVGVAGTLLSSTTWAQSLTRKETTGALFSDGKRHLVELAHDEEDHIVSMRIDHTHFWANGRRTRAGQPIRASRMTRVREDSLDVFSPSGHSVVPIHRQTLLKYYFYVEQPHRRVIELSSFRGVFQLRIDGRLIL